MRRERTTLVGTPTVIAPGAISLVGEFRLPEEEVAVLAALSSYATAQFFPDVLPRSSLVAAVVERAKIHLGEAAAALPAGSVLLSPAKAVANGQEIAFDTGPAIAVATAAAIFETAGQSISERRDEILVVAGAGHRAIHDGIGAEGELAAALHGGLIKVVAQAAAVPRVEALATHSGLHLVVFLTGHTLFPIGWLSKVREFAERDRIGYARIIDELLEQASRFAAALGEGNATAAIAAAGRYGQCMMQLAAAASAPPQSGPFLRAMELAKEIGGIAKTTSPNRGGMGVAMFATPEAASLFASACQPPLIPLSVELEHSGVRCLAPAAVHTPTPTTDLSSVSSEVTVRASLLEDRTTEKTLPALDPRDPSTPWSVVAPAEASEREPLPAEAALQPERAARRNRTRLGPAIGVILIAAALVAGWLTRSLGHHSAPPAATPDRAAARQVPAVPGPGGSAPTAPAEVTLVPAPTEPAKPAVHPATGPQTPSAKPYASVHRAHALKVGKANGHKLATAPRSEATSSPRPAAPHEPPKASSPRAGKLSHEDF
jgi:mevalonate kinase